MTSRWTCAQQLVAAWAILVLSVGLAHCHGGW